MNTYIIHNNPSLKGLNRKTMNSFWEKNFFFPLREFISLHSNEIAIENELKGLMFLKRMDTPLFQMELYTPFKYHEKAF